MHSTLSETCLCRSGSGLRSNIKGSAESGLREGESMGSLVEHKKQIVAQVQAVMDFLPDDADSAERFEPWFWWQYENFMDILRRSDLDIVLLGGLIGLLGTPFSDLLPGDSGEQGVVRLRAI